MIHTEKTVRTLKAVAVSVGVALFLWSTGLPTFFLFAEAASITSASDVLESSAPSGASNHTITFTTPNGMAIGETMEVTFDGSFTMGSVAETDIDILVDGTASTTAGAAGAATWGVVVGGSTITFTTPTDMAPASSSVIQILIGTNSVLGGTGVNQITNPAATTSYSIDIGKGASTMQDSGQVRVAIIDEVLVTAAVDTSLTFEVSGVSGATAVNGTTTTLASTNTTLPFGTLVVDELETLAHDLNVTTNAANGYTVTVALSGSLQSSTGADINSFIDGNDLAVPAAWSSPGASIANDQSYGHWGITSDDPDAGRGSEFTSNTWAGIATSSPTIVMGHTGPADGTTADIGANRVGYQIEVSALQEAGDDYNTTLRYIATPTF